MSGKVVKCVVGHRARWRDTGRQGVEGEAEGWWKMGVAAREPALCSGWLNASGVSIVGKVVVSTRAPTPPASRATPTRCHSGGSSLSPALGRSAVLIPVPYTLLIKFHVTCFRALLLKVNLFFISMFSH